MIRKRTSQREKSFKLADKLKVIGNQISEKEKDEADKFLEENFI